MSSDRLKTKGVEIEHNNMDNKQSYSISLLSCFLDALSVLFSPLNRDDDDDDDHHPMLDDKSIGDQKNMVSSNAMAQKQFRQVHQIKGA